ncbi:hypothetical protein B0H13DRAFT_2343050 [Mycena leptocephala]|nr:hypothetical protein B0H13DRAFT_2343050 [Mycena leptocephala]
MSVSHLLDKTLGVGFIGVVVAAGLTEVSYASEHHFVNSKFYSFLCSSLVVLHASKRQMAFEAARSFDSLSNTPDSSALISHTVYTYLVTHYNDGRNSLTFVSRSLLVEVLFNGLTALLVQSFLTIRIWRLSNGNKWLTGAASLLVLGEFGISKRNSPVSRVNDLDASPKVASLPFDDQPTSLFRKLRASSSLHHLDAFFSLHLHTFAQLSELKALSITVNALAAAGDIGYYDSEANYVCDQHWGRHKVGSFALSEFSTDSVLVSLCAIGSLVSIAVAGKTFIYILFFFCMGRLYCNSLLATLNARKFIRGAADGIHTTSENLSLSLREFQPKNTSLSMASKRPNISIKIDTTQEFNRDVSDEGEKSGSHSATVRFDLSSSPPHTHQAPAVHKIQGELFVCQPDAGERCLIIESAVLETP